jgi:lipoate-protein ligase A
VLGSTQPDDVVSFDRARAAGVAVVRRRTGGGAVLLTPDDPVWVEAWLPTGDPLLHPDVARSLFWVGEWWADALEALGSPGLTVHRARPRPDALGRRVCFAALGPGEVVHQGVKVVGVSQWRGRQGALFLSAAYRRWDASVLADLLRLTDEEHRAADRRATAVPGPAPTAAAIEQALVDRRPSGGSWEMVRS